MNRTALFCFLAVYLIWGSTYLAIKIATDTIPVWTLITARNLAAAPIMFALSKLARERPLDRPQLEIAALSGVFLLISNGLIGYIEKSISSGTTAVVIGSMPIWIMLFGYLFFAQAKPTWPKFAGACAGLLGVALIASDRFGSDESTAGMIALFGAIWLWAIGTLIQRKAAAVTSPFRFTAAQMLLGSLATLTIGLLCHERPAAISRESLIAFGYLVLFGSIIGFTAFSWLARNVDTQLVSTYALVNPVVAVILGSWIFDEPVDPRFFFAVSLIGVGLVLLIYRRRRVGH